LRLFTIFERERWRSELVAGQRSQSDRRIIEGVFLLVAFGLVHTTIITKFLIALETI